MFRIWSTCSDTTIGLRGSHVYNLIYSVLSRLVLEPAWRLYRSFGSVVRSSSGIGDGICYVREAFHAGSLVSASSASISASRDADGPHRLGDDDQMRTIHHHIWTLHIHAVGSDDCIEESVRVQLFILDKVDDTASKAYSNESKQGTRSKHSTEKRRHSSSRPDTHRSAQATRQREQSRTEQRPAC